MIQQLQKNPKLTHAYGLFQLLSSTAVLFNADVRLYLYIYISVGIYISIYLYLYSPFVCIQSIYMYVCSLYISMYYSQTSGLNETDALGIN